MTTTERPEPEDGLSARDRRKLEAAMAREEAMKKKSAARPKNARPAGDGARTQTKRVKRRDGRPADPSAAEAQHLESLRTYLGTYSCELPERWSCALISRGDPEFFDANGRKFRSRLAVLRELAPDKADSVSPRAPAPRATATRAPPPIPSAETYALADKTDEAAVRSAIAVVSKRAESARQTSVCLARQLADEIVNHGAQRATLAKMATTAGNLSRWEEAAPRVAAPAAEAAAEAAAEGPMELQGTDPRTGASVVNEADITLEDAPPRVDEAPDAAALVTRALELASDVSSQFVKFTITSRTHLGANPSPQTVSDFADVCLGRCLRMEREARRDAGVLAEALRAASRAPGLAARAPALELSFAGLELADAVAPESSLDLGLALLESLERRRAFEPTARDAGVALQLLAGDAGMVTVRRVAMASLHMLGGLRNGAFDMAWAPCASSGRVFAADATTKRTWLCYSRPGGGPQRWQWEFIDTADERDLYSLLVEMARVTRAGDGLSGAAARLSAAIRAAEAAPPPEARRTLPVTADDLNGDADAFDWLDDVVEGVREAEAADGDAEMADAPAQSDYAKAEAAYTAARDPKAKKTEENTTWVDDGGKASREANLAWKAEEAAADAAERESKDPRAREAWAYRAQHPDKQRTLEGKIPLEIAGAPEHTNDDEAMRKKQNEMFETAHPPTERLKKEMAEHAKQASPTGAEQPTESEPVAMDVN
mmetsp:Transcript_7938/g.23649  ORF Transcript_7938/g.23649 Transcript_7938/m.23649 type:complete len:718 (-) Transcript_7938:42-2195(-)